MRCASYTVYTVRTVDEILNQISSGFQFEYIDKYIKQSKSISPLQKT